MSTGPILQRYTDYLLTNAVWTSTSAPSTSYSLSTFATLTPAARVRFGVSTVTITATLTGAVQGDIFALPVSNLDAGNTVLTITNNGGSGGVNQAVTIATPSEGDFLLTSWIDLTTTWSVDQRTASVWNFVITSNSVNVTLGGCIWLSGPKRYLPRGLDIPPSPKSIAPTLTIDYKRLITTNEYGVDLIYDYGTQKRQLDGTFLATTTVARDDILSWIDASHGGSRPALFVRDPDTNDALICYPQPTVRRVKVRPMDPGELLQLSMVELSKGLSVF